MTVARPSGLIRVRFVGMESELVVMSLNLKRRRPLGGVRCPRWRGWGHICGQLHSSRDSGRLRFIGVGVFPRVSRKLRVRNVTERNRSIPTDVVPPDAGEFCRRRYLHVLHVRLREVPSRVGADVGQPVPLVHTEFSNANFNVQPVVVLYVYSAVGQSLVKHFPMGFFTTLNFGDQSSSCLGEVADAARHKSFPPEVLLVARSRRSPSSANANKDSYFATRPFVADGFFQRERGRVVLASPLV
jgi:hypothetical protein